MIALEAFSTLAASWSLPFLMNSDMLVKISLLSKRLIAKWFRAQKRTLSSVHSKVIKEVVPFPEKHLAIAKVAFQ